MAIPFTNSGCFLQWRILPLTSTVPKQKAIIYNHHIIQGRHHCHARFEATTTHNNNYIIIIFSLSCTYIIYIYIDICTCEPIASMTLLSVPAPLHDGHGAPFFDMRCDLWDANAEVYDLYIKYRHKYHTHNHEYYRYMQKKYTSICKEIYDV